jgi:hypothetical protein
MPVSYNYCAKIEEVVSTNEFGVEEGTVAKICLAATKEVVQYGQKDCGATVTPPLEYVQIPFKTFNLPDQFRFNFNFWIGVEQNNPSCLWVGVDQSPIGTVCVKGKCESGGGRVIAYSTIASVVEDLVDEMIEQATSGSAFETFLLLIVALVVSAFIVVGGGALGAGGIATVTGALALAIGGVVAANVSDLI